MVRYKKSFNKIAWVGGAVFLIFLLVFIYSNFSTQTSSPNYMGLLITGVLLGAIIMFLLWKLYSSQGKKVVHEDSHTIVESIRKVFKVVCAEGHFNELYNFEDTKKIFGFIPSTKRALVIIQAKVLIGFNFEKCVWDIDEDNHKIKLVSFPQPEILSIEPDYKYYNFDEGIFNLLNRDDLTRIQVNGKKQVELAAIKSHLPKIAADQMRTILTEVVQSKNWQVEDTYKITEEPRSLPSSGA